MVLVRKRSSKVSRCGGAWASRALRQLHVGGARVYSFSPAISDFVLLASFPAWSRSLVVFGDCLVFPATFWWLFPAAGGFLSVVCCSEIYLLSQLTCFWRLCVIKSWLGSCVTLIILGQLVWRLVFSFCFVLGREFLIFLQVFNLCVASSLSLGYFSWLNPNLVVWLRWFRCPTKLLTIS